ncbi:ABC transporter ATP-binding protein [Cellulomonas fimi]|uniref:ABC transporter ATP-binding protein n=1 Tax=Cellulomonas fimi TaxID=1708 RepID=A0A7Y0M062_CELFI|nr:ABC transporter ATP-binding protein [Cellulomonas fimi]NMR21355.1 ABC transporter ATP-binding protein [Cellulomonas fimi]
MSATTSAPLLQARGISKSFGAVKAVDDVDITASPGRISAVIGPNGAGKTTLFNALSGFSAADAGTVTLDGRDITSLPPHRIARLGLVRTFQTARPLRTATVLENVLAGTYLHGRGGIGAALFPTPRVRRAEAALVERSRATLAAVGLLAEQDRYPDELAAGQLRLLEIARGLAAEPRVLLLDEPAAGLNKVETSRLEESLLEIRASGTAVLLVEHDVDLVLRVSDHVTVLDFGRLLRSGAPEDIRRDPAVAAAYFGTEDPVPAPSDEGGA